jgi:tRNA G46 methylase TrmB
LSDYGRVEVIGIEIVRRGRKKALRRPEMRRSGNIRLFDV